MRIYFPAKNNYGMECPGGDEARGCPEGRRRDCRGTVGLEGHLQPSACETSVECDNEGGGIQKSLQSGLSIQVPSLGLGASRCECRRRRCTENIEMRYFRGAENGAGNYRGAGACRK